MFFPCTVLSRLGGALQNGIGEISPGSEDRLTYLHGLEANGLALLIARRVVGGFPDEGIKPLSGPVERPPSTVLNLARNPFFGSCISTIVSEGMDEEPDDGLQSLAYPDSHSTPVEEPDSIAEEPIEGPSGRQDRVSRSLELAVNILDCLYQKEKAYVGISLFCLRAGVVAQGELFGSQLRRQDIRPDSDLRGVGTSDTSSIYEGLDMLRRLRVIGHTGGDRLPDLVIDGGLVEREVPYDEIIEPVPSKFNEFYQ